MSENAFVSRKLFRRVVTAFALVLVVVCGWIYLGRPYTQSVAPQSAQDAAVKAVEQQYGVKGVKVWTAARTGNCVVVRVRRPDQQFNGPSVSLEKRDNKWTVRRIGDDFDPDRIIGKGSNVQCP